MKMIKKFEKLLHYTNATFKHHNASYYLSDRTDLNTVTILFNLPNAGDLYNWLVHSSSISDVSISTGIGGNPANGLEQLPKITSSMGMEQ
jgi:hypothetical protein